MLFMLILLLLSFSFGTWSSMLNIPPPLFKFLTCHVDVHLKAAGSNFYLSGEMAMNTEQDKLFLALYGDNPQHYWYKTNITIVAAPTSFLTLGIWKLQDGICAFQSVTPDQIPPLSLPANAMYTGNKTISGIECEVWRVANPYPQVEYVDVSVSRGNVYLLESQAYLTESQVWTFASQLRRWDVKHPMLDEEVKTKLGVSTTIALTKHNNSEPVGAWFQVPEGCR